VRRLFEGVMPSNVDDLRRHLRRDRSRDLAERLNSLETACVPSVNEGDVAWAHKALEGGATVAGPTCQY
jgi:hypothetical protein